MRESAIYAALSISESTRCARVRRLVNDHVIRNTAVAKRKDVTRSIAIGLRIYVAATAEPLIEDLLRWPEVEFGAAGIGAFELLATLSAARVPSVMRLDPLSRSPVG